MLQVSTDEIQLDYEPSFEITTKRGEYYLLWCLKEPPLCYFPIFLLVSEKECWLVQLFMETSRRSKLEAVTEKWLDMVEIINTISG